MVIAGGMVASSNGMRNEEWRAIIMSDEMVVEMNRNAMHYTTPNLIINFSMCNRDCYLHHRLRLIRESVSANTTIRKQQANQETMGAVVRKTLETLSFRRSQSAIEARLPM
jgi:hypothetical protein